MHACAGGRGRAGALPHSRVAGTGAKALAVARVPSRKAATKGVLMFVAFGGGGDGCNSGVRPWVRCGAAEGGLAGWCDDTASVTDRCDALRMFYEIASSAAFCMARKGPPPRASLPRVLFSPYKSWGEGHEPGQFSTNVSNLLGVL
jgi:hypothetical protein